MQNTDWRERALGRLVLAEDATIETAEAAINDAESLATAEGQTLWEMFADPREWAQEQIASWRNENYWYLDDQVGYPWQYGLLLGPVLSVGLGALAGVVALLAGSLATQIPLKVAFSGQVLGLGISMAGWVYSYYSPRRALSQTWLRLGLVILAVAVLGATLATSTWSPLLTELHVAFVIAGYLILAAICGALLFRFGDGADQAPTRYTQDEDWLTQSRQLLHTHSNLSHHEITDLLDEAQSHAEQSGQTLVAEFGAPARYAAQYKTKSALGYRRDENYTQGFLMLALAVVFGTTSGGTWWSILGVTILAGFGCHTIWQTFRNRRTSKTT